MPDSPAWLGDDDDDGDDKAPFRPIPSMLVLRDVDVQVLAQVAEYRNALARSAGLKIPGRGWSRTSLAERIIRKACKNLRKELAPIIDAYGPMPTIDLAKGKDEDEKERFRREMDRFVRKGRKGK